MTTNYMGRTEDSSGNVVAIIAIVVLLAIATLFLVYGLPALRGATAPQGAQDIQVNIPSPLPQGGGTSGQGGGQTTPTP